MKAAVLCCSGSHSEHSPNIKSILFFLLFRFYKHCSVYVCEAVCLTRRCGLRADEKNGDCWSPVDQKVAPLLCSGQRNTQITQNPKHGLLWQRTLDDQKLTTVIAAGLTTWASKQLLSVVVCVMSTRCKRRERQMEVQESGVKLLWSFDGAV